MKLQDILSPEEIARYNEGWESFKGRYKLNSPYNTHSGMPVISEVYQFPGKPLFRAHVFGRRLMRSQFKNPEMIFFVMQRIGGD
ncbi:MAG: hypothetical protein NTY95_15610 [Bacteroidia bacterium]|nr:hypothetical protein [Bacteroidia bacterium]